MRRRHEDGGRSAAMLRSQAEARAHTEDAYEASALAFVVGAEQALRRVFPSGDPVIRRWDQIFGHADKSAGSLTNESNVEAAVVLFHEAHAILKSDRFESLMDGVRAETIGELLDQAEALLGNGWLSAAMVTAGGAVEGTLRHLCASASIAIKGHGSIEKYNNAIGEKRGEGIEILTVSQTKMVTTFGDSRNRAAHYPREFAQEQTRESVKNMIDAIRMFIGNVRA